MNLCEFSSVIQVRIIYFDSGQILSADRIAIRDQVTYCGILLDDNNRKPLVRLWFNNSQKYISLFDNAERKETKVQITKLDELYTLADRIKASATTYLVPNGTPSAVL